MSKSRVLAAVGVVVVALGAVVGGRALKGRGHTPKSLARTTRDWAASGRNVG